MTQKDSLQDHEIYALIIRLTGHKFTFAQTSDRMWGKDSEVESGIFWQLMPDTIGGMDFFDWYCDKRDYHQFFKTKADCLNNFLFYWCVWQDEKRKNN